MSNFAFLAGGAHVNEPLGLGRCRIAAGELVQIPGRNGDDLGGGQRPRYRQQKAEDEACQPPQILHGMPSFGPAGLPLP
jgi:hypothetical protein